MSQRIHAIRSAPLLFADWNVVGLFSEQVAGSLTWVETSEDSFSSNDA